MAVMKECSGDGLGALGTVIVKERGFGILLGGLLLARALEWCYLWMWGMLGFCWIWVIEF